MFFSAFIVVIDNLSQACQRMNVQVRSERYELLLLETDRSDEELGFELLKIKEE